MNRPALPTKPIPPARIGKLRNDAEAFLRKQWKRQKPSAGDAKSAVEAQRLLHELQVYQIELEMQNYELQEARDRAETLLEKYADLYDFAPVGYMSLDEQGKILELNLTGATLLGVERARLVNRRLLPFIAPASRPVFLEFLDKIFTTAGKQVCETALLQENDTWFWANFHGTRGISAGGPQKWCRVAISDITALKMSEEAQHRLEALAVVNHELKDEIVRRQAVEASLKQSEQHYRQLLEHSRVMQDQVKQQSRQELRAQEEERKAHQPGAA